MTHYARQLYKRFGDTLLFVSNYKLFGIPYVPLVNFNQLLEIGEDKPKYYSEEEIKTGALPSFYYDEDHNILDKYKEYKEYRFIRVKIDDTSYEIKKKYLSEDNEKDMIFKEKFPDDVQKDLFIKRWVPQGTVVLIDEIEDLLSHRNYADFPLELLNVLTQQRKKHVYILCSAQRFFMVDKIFRGITTHVIDCNKFWRFESMRFFDAWDYENAMNTQLIKPYGAKWWFVHNKDYNSYSTEQMISKDMSKNFISNDEKLARIGLDGVVNSDAINKPSKAIRQERKARRKRA